MSAQAEPAAHLKELNIQPAKMALPKGLNIQPAVAPPRGAPTSELNIQEDFTPIHTLDDKENLNIQEAHFVKKLWKRSKNRPGYLIKRIKGYYVVESPYGVSYGKPVGPDPITGKPKLSFDSKLYEHAGHVKWSALIASGRFVKESAHGRTDNITRNSLVPTDNA
jgi:hypothetical protein